MYPRKHLIRDLEPYSCPLDNCATPFEFFTKKEDLLRHLNNKHVKISYLECRLCEHSDRFNDGTALEAHLRDSHRGDLLEEDIPITVDVSTRRGIDWPELCPVCQLSLVQDRPISSKLKEHLRQEHRGDVLDEDVEKVIGDKVEICPKCDVTVSQTLPLSSLDHLSRCLHDFSLRALPWNDYTGAPPLRTEQWKSKILEALKEPDQHEVPRPLDKTYHNSLDKLHELFPEIQLSDEPAKELDTTWRQDSTLLNDSDATSSPDVPRLEDSNYFREDNDSPKCPISDGLLEAFDLYLRHAIMSIETSGHAATSELLGELETLRTSPISDAESLQAACSRLRRLDGPFRRFDQTLLLDDEDAQSQFQRIDHLTLIAEEEEPRYVTVFCQTTRVLT